VEDGNEFGLGICCLKLFGPHRYLTWVHICNLFHDLNVCIYVCCILLRARSIANRLQYASFVLYVNIDTVPLVSKSYSHFPLLSRQSFIIEWEYNYNSSISNSMRWYH